MYLLMGSIIICYGKEIYLLAGIAASVKVAKMISIDIVFIPED
jgi:hypothetical protein